jgi:invasion protein IalB
MTDLLRSDSRPKPDVRKTIVTILLGMVVSGGDVAQAASQQKSSSIPEIQNANITPRGHRTATDITFGDWRKLCFKPAGAKSLCRTSITGKFDTGQIAVRVDLIERESGHARLQLFVPVGMYLQAGVKLSVDKGSPYPVPYTWCLTNGCVAADVAAPKLIKEMESGQTLGLEFVDTNILSLTTSVPLAQFVSVHKGAPEKTFDQDIDE